MTEPMDSHDKILERLQTKGDTQHTTLADELRETPTAILVCLFNLRKQGFVEVSNGLWSARLPE